MWTRIALMLVLGACGGPVRSQPVSSPARVEAHAQPIQPSARSRARLQLELGVERVVPGTSVFVKLILVRAAKPGISSRHGVRCAPPVPPRALLALRQADRVERTSWTALGAYDLFGLTWQVHITGEVVTLAWQPAISSQRM